MTEGELPLFYLVPLLIFGPVFVLVLRSIGLFRILGELVSRPSKAPASPQQVADVRRGAPRPRGARPGAPALTPLRLAGQALAFVPFLAVLAVFSDGPTYRYTEAGTARIKVSVNHSGQRKEECRRRSREELAELAPNMRAPRACSRERWPVHLQVELDGTRLIDAEVPPAGLRADMPSSLYRVIDVAAGEHRIAARIRDRGDSDAFTHADARTVTLAPGQSLVIGFDARAGGFQYR